MFKNTTFFNRFKANYYVYCRNVGQLNETVDVRGKYTLHSYKSVKVQGKTLYMAYKNGQYRVLTLNAYGVQLDYKVN